MSTGQYFQFGVAVTPSDSTVQPGGKFDALYVGGAGNVTLFTGGAAILFTAVPAGTILPVGGTRVNSTATTATAMVALYGAG
jgi:hypothetical protein